MSGPTRVPAAIPAVGFGLIVSNWLPVQVQLLGGNPDLLAQAALVSIRAGARAVDLNFGCPARTVNRHDGGATLLQYPDRIREIVAAEDMVVAAGPVEVAAFSVKLNALLGPPPVVTVTLAEPDAFAAMANVAVI